MTKAADRRRIFAEIESFVEALVHRFIGSDKFASSRRRRSDYGWEPNDVLQECKLTALEAITEWQEHPALPIRALIHRRVTDTLITINRRLGDGRTFTFGAGNGFTEDEVMGHVTEGTQYLGKLPVSLRPMPDSARDIIDEIGRLAADFWAELCATHPYSEAVGRDKASTRLRTSMTRQRMQQIIILRVEQARENARREPQQPAQVVNHGLTNFSAAAQAKAERTHTLRAWKRRRGAVIMEIIGKSA